MDKILPKRNCPLCNEIIPFVGVEYGKRHKYSCPNCSVFEVCTGVEEHVVKLSAQQKAEISKGSVRCGKEFILLIWLDPETKAIIWDCKPVRTTF